MDRFEVFENRAYVYVVGSASSCGTSRKYCVISFDKTEGSNTRELCMVNDSKAYSAQEMRDYLNLAGSNRRNGQLTKIADAVAIIGCIRFVKGYYLVIITARMEEGELDGHRIFSSKGSELVPLFSDLKGSNSRSGWSSIFSASQDPEDSTEEEFKSLFKLNDLSKAYYWSYTYNLAVSLQRNVACDILSQSATFASFPPAECDDRFIWNWFLSQPLVSALQTTLLQSRWVVPLVHGSFRQQRCSIFSRSITLTLVGRRSRHFAGTRYLKRGINDEGDVANDVEIEQIVQDHMFFPSKSGTITSFVQVRGSIPTFWSQETSVAIPRPPIKRGRFDPWFTATKKHFANLMQRYGDTILVLNLVKQVEKRKRETIVGNDFKHAVEHINAFLPSHMAVEYRAVDFTRLSKLEPTSLLRALDATAGYAVDSTGFFTCRANILRKCSNKSIATQEMAEWMEQAMADQRIMVGKRRKELFAKLPLRWSTRQRTFVPMRMNTVFKLPSKGLRRLQSYSNAAEPPNGTSSTSSSPDSSSVSSSPSIRHSLLTSTSFASENEAALGFLAQSGLIDDDDDDDGDGGPDGVEEDGLVVDEIGDDDIEDDTQLAFSLLERSGSPSSPGSSSFYGSSPLKTRSRSFASKSFRTGSISIRPRELEGIQRGVVRTNCIDCLDRTNIAQFLIGLRFLNQQLITLGVLGKQDRIGTDSMISSVLMEMYEELGDRISLQYGGSDAHRKHGKLMQSASSSSRQKSLYTSIKRYYSNAFTDHAKQDAINVFLGTYRKEHHHRITGEKNSPRDDSQHHGDFYLHNRAVTERPDVGLDPVATTETEWWKGALQNFAEQVAIPLKALALYAEQSCSTCPPMSDEEVPSLTGFDTLFSRPFNQPIELTTAVPVKLKKVEVRPPLPPPPTAQSQSLPKAISLPKSSSSASLSMASQAKGSSTPPKPRSLRRRSSSDSTHSGESVETQTSAASSVYRTIRNTLFGGSSASLSSKASKLEEETSSLHQSEGPNPLTEIDSEDSLSSSLRGLQDLEPVYRDYIMAAHDPFGTLFAVSSSQSSKKPLTAWDEASHERAYKQSYADYTIDDSDAWGMRKLQAYSSATTIIMHGPYKGYPRTAQATILFLTVPK